MLIMRRALDKKNEEIGIKKHSLNGSLNSAIFEATVSAVSATLPPSAESTRRQMATLPNHNHAVQPSSDELIHRRDDTLPRPLNHCFATPYMCQSHPSLRLSTDHSLFVVHCG